MAISVKGKPLYHLTTECRTSATKNKDYFYFLLSLIFHSKALLMANLHFLFFCSLCSHFTNGSASYYSKHITALWCYCYWLLYPVYVFCHLLSIDNFAWLQLMKERKLEKAGNCGVIGKLVLHGGKWKCHTKLKYYSKCC